MEIRKNGGNYAGIMLSRDWDSYLIIDITIDIKIYAYGHYYRDSGGSSGEKVTFAKWDGLEYQEYQTVNTYWSGGWYELVTLEKGRYKVEMQKTGRGYVNFDEWKIERTN